MHLYVGFWRLHEGAGGARSCLLARSGGQHQVLLILVGECLALDDFVQCFTGCGPLCARSWLVAVLCVTKRGDG